MQSCCKGYTIFCPERRKQTPWRRSMGLHLTRRSNTRKFFQNHRNRFSRCAVLTVQGRNKDFRGARRWRWAPGRPNSFLPADFPEKKLLFLRIWYNILNLKHILLPVDPFAFLRATRPCNIAALVFYLFTMAYVICSAAAGSTVTGVMSVLMAASMLALSVCAVKGATKWGI